MEWRILAEAPNEVLGCLESGFIRLLGTLAPNGYNLTEGGETSRWSEESKVKLRASLRSSALFAAAAKKTGAAKRGKQRPPEVGLKISASKAGYSHSTEAREKMARAQRGRVMPEATRSRISGALLGLRRSEETKAKLRDAQARLAAARRALSDNAARQVMAALAEGASIKDTARMFGVSRTVIRNIRDGRGGYKTGGRIVLGSGSIEGNG